MTDTPVPPVRAPRTPGAKFVIVLLLAGLLTIPLLTVYLLNYDRQAQSTTAQASIVEGWGGAQVIAGPIIAIPYPEQVSETVQENGRPVTRTNTVWRELILSPQTAVLDTGIKPERRRRSIYEAVVYEARATGTARFALPADLARVGVTADRLALDRAELRFGLSDARGLFGAPPSASIAGRALTLQPGHGPRETGGSGFFAWIDGRALTAAPVDVRFAFAFRGNASLALAPQAGDTRWTVTSPWPHPSFAGGFLPATRSVSDTGFKAAWRVGNLALGRALATAGEEPAASAPLGSSAADEHVARVELVAPLDLYDEVNRSVKYGFLFIGFTFAAFLMFDVVGGVRVAVPEYLLVGAGLVLFFVLLLALAEVIGFMPAYLVAATAIIGLLAAYSAAVLGSWRRGRLVAALLAGLYAVLYLLLSLEAYSLLIGSVLLFGALAAMMFITRHLDWSGVKVR